MFLTARPPTASRPNAGGLPLPSGVIAIANHRLIGSGTVRKSIEIGLALKAADIPVELWVTEAGGDMWSAAEQLPVIVLGGSSGLRAAWALARSIRRRQPAVLLSAGKHFHLRARLGLTLSGRARQTRFVGRASNTGKRPGKGPLRQRFAAFFYAQKYAGMNLVVSVSRALASELQEVLGGACPPVVTIPNGVDVGRVRALAAEPVAHPWINDPSLNVSVLVGRIDKQKGVDVLLHALALLPQNWRVILIGAGKLRYLSEMNMLAEQLGVSGRADFIGFTSNPFSFVANANLFVLPSRWEGASNALIEAMVCGIPLVASDCAGNAEQLENGRLGALAPVGDAAALAEAMLSEITPRRSVAIRTRAIEQASIDRCLGAYVDTLVSERNVALRTREAQAD